MSNGVEPLCFLSGTEALGNAHDGWPLDEAAQDDQDRVFRAKVVFARPFRAVPIVHIGIVGFDISNHDAARLTASVEGVTVSGFDIQLSTWLNSKIWRVDVSWLAIGL